MKKLIINTILSVCFVLISAVGLSQATVTVDQASEESIDELNMTVKSDEISAKSMVEKTGVYHEYMDADVKATDEGVKIVFTSKVDEEQFIRVVQRFMMSIEASTVHYGEESMTPQEFADHLLNR